MASLHPIEDFWAAVKKENYNSEWEVEHFAQLKQRILAKARQILPETPPHSTWPNPEVRGKRMYGRISLLSAKIDNHQDYHLYEARNHLLKD